MLPRTGNRTPYSTGLLLPAGLSGALRRTFPLWLARRTDSEKLEAPRSRRPSSRPIEGAPYWTHPAYAVDGKRPLVSAASVIIIYDKKGTRRAPATSGTRATPPSDSR